ncbi:hypothetical protein [Roseateles sp. PN1]
MATGGAGFQTIPVEDLLFFIGGEKSNHVETASIEAQIRTQTDQ